MSPPPPPPPPPPPQHTPVPEPIASNQTAATGRATVRSALSLQPVRREAASTRMAGRVPNGARLFTPAAFQTAVLSDFNRNRKLQSPNLIDKLRELIPHSDIELTEAEREAKDAELRRASFEQATWRKVYRNGPKMKPSMANNDPNPVGVDSNLAIQASPVAARRDADGYSNTAYLEQVANCLAEAAPHWEQVRAKSRRTPTRRFALLTSLKSSLLAPDRMEGLKGVANSRKSSQQNKTSRKREAFTKMVQLGHSNDSDFRAGKLKWFIHKQYLPEHVVETEGEALTGQARRHCCRCSCKNLGTCEFVKLYIMVTLLLAVLFCLADPCYPVRQLLWGVDTTKGDNSTVCPLGGSSVMPNFTMTTHKSQSWINQSTVVASRPKPDLTTSLPPLRSVVNRSDPLAVVIQQRFHLGHSNGTLNQTVTVNTSTSRRMLNFEAGNDSTTTPTSTEPLFGITLQHGSSTASPCGSNSSMYCPFKLFFLTWLTVGLVVYLIIFCFYSCNFVLYYHDFNWYLAESQILAGYSTVLLIASIVGFILKSHLPATTFGFINALLGLVISMCSYLSHNLGLTPLANLSVEDDPDRNQAARILGEKNFNKLFFGSKSAPLKGVPSKEKH